MRVSVSDYATLNDLYNEHVLLYIRDNENTVQEFYFLLYLFIKTECIICIFHLSPWLMVFSTLKVVNKMLLDTDTFKP